MVDLSKSNSTLSVCLPFSIMTGLGVGSGGGTTTGAGAGGGGTSTFCSTTGGGGQGPAQSLILSSTIKAGEPPALTSACAAVTKDIIITINTNITIFFIALSFRSNFNKLIFRGKFTL